MLNTGENLFVGYSDPVILFIPRTVSPAKLNQKSGIFYFAK